MQRGNGEMSSGSCWGSAAPVSYTHLDVYKRQLQSIGYDTIASGDSFNDLGMIQASKAGFLFKSTEQIKACLLYTSRCV